MPSPSHPGQGTSAESGDLASAAPSNALLEETTRRACLDSAHVKNERPPVRGRQREDSQHLNHLEAPLVVAREQQARARSV